MLIAGIIISLIIIVSFYFVKSKKSKPKALRANSPLSPLHGWNVAEDLKEPEYAPWNELLRSKLVDPKDIGIANLDDINIDDLVFIKWRSPQESWDHLAGAEGYVVISISEKKQIDFIITSMS